MDIILTSSVHCRGTALAWAAREAAPVSPCAPRPRPLPRRAAACVGHSRRLTCAETEM